MKHNEDQFRLLVESLPHAIAILSKGDIVYVNPSCAALFGFSSSTDLLGKSIWEFVPPRYKTIVEKHFRQLGGDATQDPPIEIELLRHGSQPIDVGLTTIPFTFRGKPAIQAVFHDITSRKLIEEQIRQRNIELAALNAVAASVSASLELNTTINNALDEVLGLDMFAGEAYGMAFLLDEKTDEMYLAAHRGAPREHPCLAHSPQVGECLCGLAIHEGEIVISEDSFADDRHTRKWEGMPQHKDICLPLKVRGEVLGVMNIRLPITQVITPDVIELLTSVADQISVAIKNARLFEAVDLQREQLRVLGARLSEVEEAERRRLARELHDQVGQNLTALGINLNVIKTQIPDDMVSGVETFLDESLLLVEQTTESIRDVMSDLRPPMLDDYGLMATLRWFGDQFASRVGLPVTVQGEELIPRLAEPVENALFRIATEALTNVAKHAQATEATVALEVEDKTLRLIIQDDGIGFNPELLDTLEMDRGWGLLTMAERAEALGGQFWVESQPSHVGTRVIVEIVR
ncbi:MAG: GAF domain-containing protein [Anaerolineaceae bacterium]|nr:MAG: GAF domain-containing protein [Anaerolineaceae bacterium]